MQANLFAAFKPDADALLRHMSKYIDDAALERIAAFDDLGGRERIAFIAHHLRILRDKCTMPNPISGDLTRVCLNAQDWSRKSIGSSATRIGVILQAIGSVPMPARS